MKTLENVFLKLCVRDQTINNEENGKVIFKASDNEKAHFEKVKKKKQSFIQTIVSNSKEEIKNALKLPKWHNLKGLIFKNSLLMRRDIGYVISFFFKMLKYLLIFSIL